MRKLTAVLAALFIAALLCSLAAAQEKKVEPDTKAASPERTYEWYKADYLLYEIENGKRTNARNYTVLLRDNNRDVEVKTGSRVPVATGSFSPGAGSGATVNTQFQYLDVGVNIRASMQQIDNRLSLMTNFDISSVAPESVPAGSNVPLPILRQIRANNVVTAVTLGKPLLISSLDDAISKRRYEVEVTVTKQ